MKQFISIIIFLFALSNEAKSQIRYSIKLEAGYLKYLHRTLTVDPGPNWKGYNLRDDQNGMNINLINGITFFNKKGFAGFGLGYLNFEGLTGYSMFTDFRYQPLNKRLSPFLNLKLGYSTTSPHLACHPGSSAQRTGLIELGGGLNYQFAKEI